MVKHSLMPEYHKIPKEVQLAGYVVPCRLSDEVARNLQQPIWLIVDSWLGDVHVHRILSQLMRSAVHCSLQSLRPWWQPLSKWGKFEYSGCVFGVTVHSEPAEWLEIQWRTRKWDRGMPWSPNIYQNWTYISEWDLGMAFGISTVEEPWEALQTPPYRNYEQRNLFPN